MRSDKRESDKVKEFTSMLHCFPIVPHGVLGPKHPMRRLVLAVPLLVLGLWLTSAVPPESHARAAESGVEAEPRIHPIQLSNEECAWLGEHPRVRVHFESWPPFLISEGARLQGMTIDYLELILGQLGLEVEYVHTTWTKALNDIRKRRMDVLPILTHLPEREEFLVFTREYLSFPIVIFSRKDTFFISDLADLRRATIAVERDYAMHSRLKRVLSGTDLLVVSTTTEALEALATGRADAYVGNLAVGSYLIQKLGLNNLKVAAPAPFGTHDQAMAVRGDWPVLARLLDRGLEAVTWRGHQEIRQRWFAVRYEHGITPADVWKWVLRVGGAAGVLLLLVFLWNRRLKQEIEKRRRVETALQESLREKQALLQAMPDSMFVLTREGKCVDFRAEREKDWAISPAEIFGKNARNAGGSDDDLKLITEGTDQVFATGEPQSVEYELETPKGIGVYDARIVPLDDERVLGVARDITVRKRAEGALQEAREKLEQRVSERTRELKEANEKLQREMAERKQMQATLVQTNRMASMGLLAAGVAHEINNPLTYVLYNLESLAEGLPKLTHAVRQGLLLNRDQPDRSEAAPGAAWPHLGVAELDDMVAWAKVAVEGAHRVRNIVRDLKTFSHVEEDRRVPVYLSQVIESTINIAFNEIKYRARVVKEYGSTQPLMASEGRLSQVFLNLLMNAAQAIEEGDVEHNEIRIRTWTEREEVLVEVRDTGRGIKPEQLRHLFEPFFTTKKTGIGSGLGLSICHNIITSLGGKIEVESEVGKGTRFLVRLPTGQKEEAAPSISAPSKEEEKGTTVDGRVLVIDDEPGIGSVIKRILDREYDVVVAESGAEGKRMLEEDLSYDLIICDLMMPEVSGMDVYEWLSDSHPDLAERVVFMTGGAFTPRSRELLQRVPNRWFEKPFKSENLKAIVREFIMARKAT